MKEVYFSSKRKAEVVNVKRMRFESTSHSFSGFLKKNYSQHLRHDSMTITETLPQEEEQPGEQLVQSRQHLERLTATERWIINEHFRRNKNIFFSWLPVRHRRKCIFKYTLRSYSLFAIIFLQMTARKYLNTTLGSHFLPKSYHIK